MQEYKQRISELENELSELRNKLSIAIDENSRDTKWFQNIIDNLPNPLFIKNDKGQFVKTNQSFEELVGLSKEELLGKSDLDFFPKEEAEVFLKIDSEILENGGINWNEEKLTVDNETHDLITSKVRVVDGYDLKYVLGVITDITDKENQHIILQQKKDELENEKQNNQTLLKEVHHRVKNNLQVVSSLLNLQMEAFEQKEVRKAFDNCKNRILAMANVHEILYKTGNFSNINFATYIQTLINNLRDSYKVDDNIRFDLSLINVFLNVDIAIPLGMAINEIVINSIKHGKREDQQLLIYLNLKVENSFYVLELGDNGQGYTNPIAKEHSTFGVELINLFCNQINAKIVSNSKEEEEGIHYQIAFKKQKV